MFKRFSNAWLTLVINYPKWILLLIALVLLVAIAGLPRFKLDASADSLTLENDAALGYFREVSKNYSSGDMLIVTFTPRQDLFSDAALQVLARLQADLEAVEGVNSVNSILNVPLLYSPRRNLREVSQENLTLLSPGVDRDQAREEFLNSPIYREMILSPDGNTTAMQLNIGVDRRYIELVQERDALREKRSGNQLTAGEQARLDAVTAEFLEYRTQSETESHRRVEVVRSIVAEYQDEAQIFIGGVSMITADMISFIQKDLIVFGGAALAFILLVLAVIFRSLRFVIIPMATCLSAVTLMLGLISWLDWRLTVISSNFVALLLIISLAIIIHLIVRYREYAEENPDWNQAQLVTATLKFMVKPCIYTVLTSALAFASLVVSNIRPVIDFGWMMTIGLFFALILAFLLMPASLMLLSPTRPKAATGETGSEPKRFKPVPLYISAFVERRGGLVWLFSGILLGLGIWGLTRLQVENRFIDYFHEDTEIYQGLSLIDNKLGGTTFFDILIQDKAVPGFAETEDMVPAVTDEDDPFAEVDPFGAVETEDGADPFADDADPFADDESEPSSVWMTVAGLELIDRIHRYLDEQPEIGKVQSLATLYRVGIDLNGSLNNFELAVMDKSVSGEIRQVLLAPYRQGKHETRISMRIKDSWPGLQRSELLERIHHDLESQFNLDMEHVNFTGLLVLYNNMLQSLFSSQIVTLGTVFFGIMLMFMVLFRSLVVALIAIIPNILAALVILGSMGLFGIPLDMMTITIAAITVGMGVDNAIHYIHRFKTEVRKDGDYITAMHRSHGSIGRALFYTTSIIFFGFSIMMLSQFIPTIYFGILTGCAMVAALTGALFLLPRLILLMRPFTREIAKGPATPASHTAGPE